jgi:hypothetical protein
VIRDTLVLLNHESDRWPSTQQPYLYVTAFAGEVQGPPLVMVTVIDIRAGHFHHPFDMLQPPVASRSIELCQRKASSQ